MPLRKVSHLSGRLMRRRVQELDPRRVFRLLKGIRREVRRGAGKG